MGHIEAREAIVHGRLVENVRIPYVRDEYYETIVMPGFSDGHAHPQVIDLGDSLDRVWADSYQWIEGRRLRVNEATLRSDLEVSSKLAELLYKRALLEGTTLIAVTGRLEANVSAWMSMPVKPRVVFLPTVMNRRGWATVEDLEPVIARLRGLIGDGLARIGVFVHSLRYSSPSMVFKALILARKLRSILGMHLSEGVEELEDLSRIVGKPPYGARIVGVHCMENEDLNKARISCISCPTSNLLLYSRTRQSLSGVAGFGSDWPLLLGTIPRHMNVIRQVYRQALSPVLKRATIGGYKVYGLSYTGDFVAYDSSPEGIMSGVVEPKLVVVSWRPAVVEGRLVWSGEDLDDVYRSIEEAINEAMERHKAVDAPEGGYLRRIDVSMALERIKAIDMHAI